MTALVALPVIVPLLGASLGVLASPFRWLQRLISLFALTADVVVGVEGYLDPEAVTLPRLLRLPLEPPRGESGPPAGRTEGMAPA